MLSSSVIEIETQVLRQAVLIVGTPFTLNYRSDRVPGRRAAYCITIPLSRESVPSGLKAIELEVEIAGQRFSQGFAPKRETRYTYTGNGKDGGGNLLTGRQ